MEHRSVTHDVIIAGGGIAGTAAAAALGDCGYGVLIVEPGLDHAKRLAGELVHPPGVHDLNELGMLKSLEQVGTVPVEGFAVFESNGTPLRQSPSVASSTGAYLLPYTEVAGLGGQGLAMDHAILTTTMLSTVSKHSNVTVWDDARVSAIDLSSPEFAQVTIKRGGQESKIRSRLLVAADGRNSQVRRMGGIRDKQVHLSNMTSYRLRDCHLPHPGFGHVFAGGPAPALAYAISADETRIMFDLPLESSHLSAENMAPHVTMLTDSLRRNVEHAIKTQQPLRAENRTVVPETVARGRLVCVGDAGGSCHPISASGMSACTRDALRLRDALRETAGNIPQALALYAARRKGPHRTRTTAAKVLYEVFSGRTPEMQLMRQGLLSYWKGSSRGRQAAMSLLTAHEDRLPVLVREYIQVCRHALPGLVHVDTRVSTTFGLARSLVKVIGVACLE